MQTHRTVYKFTQSRLPEEGKREESRTCLLRINSGLRWKCYTFPRTGEGPTLTLFEISGRDGFPEIRHKIVHLISTTLISYSPRASTNV